MVTMFVRHKVSDFGTWKQAFDAFAPTQDRLGVRAKAVYQAADDPNDVTVTHDFDSLDAAHAFVGSEELRAAMQQAGVTAEPSVWFAARA